MLLKKHFDRAQDENRSSRRTRPPVAYQRHRSHSFDNTLDSSSLLPSSALGRKSSNISVDSLERDENDDVSTTLKETPSQTLEQILPLETDPHHRVRSVGKLHALETKTMQTVKLESSIESLSKSSLSVSLQSRPSTSRVSQLIKIFEPEPSHQPARPILTKTTSRPIIKNSIHHPHPPPTTSSNAVPPLPIPPTPSASLPESDSSPLPTESFRSRDSTRSNSSETTLVPAEEFDTNNEANTEQQNAIIQETIKTEETYIRILSVLATKLPRYINDVCRKDDHLRRKFDHFFRPIFKAFKTLYQLHNEEIHPKMMMRMNKDRPGLFWTVLEENFARIESSYTAYFLAFDEIRTKLDAFRLQHPVINDAMAKAQQDLDKLDPITQLNCPNQRLVRYPLLMSQYLKRADPESPDYEHTKAILDEIQCIPKRCGEQLVISPVQLEKLRQRLENKGECLKDQTVLWHGSVRKQSPRQHANIARRYLILLSNRILVFRESGTKLELNRELTLRELTITLDSDRKIQLNNDLKNQFLYPFHVHAVEKSYEFLTDQSADRDVWVRKINEASKALLKRSAMTKTSRMKPADERLFGTKAPKWVPDVDVTQCQQCHNRFRTGIRTDRHHCRACGRCICGGCSTKKLTLPYCSADGDVKVCDRCYGQSTGKDMARSQSQQIAITKDPNRVILFGDFYRGMNKNKVWIDLGEDFSLHVYEGRLDEVEEFSIDLTKIDSITLDNSNRLFTLKGNNTFHQFTLTADHRIDSTDIENVNREIRSAPNPLEAMTSLWYSTLMKAKNGQMPDWYEGKRLSSDSGYSG